MRRERRKCATVCLVAVVFLSSFFGQTIDAFRLTKTAKRDERRQDNDASAAPVRAGEVLYGVDFEPRANLGSLVGRAPGAQNVQADFTGWPKALAQDVLAKQAAFRQLSPSLQCARDQMRFGVIGQAVSQLALAQGNSPPLPLNSIPPNCGFNTQRNAIGIVIVVPFDGCSVVQQDGAFALPLRFQGVPVLLVCSRPPLPLVPSPPILPPAPIIDIPSVLPPPNPPIPQVPLLPSLLPPPIPQVPMLPPVFGTKGFLAQAAFDPSFQQSFFNPLLPYSQPPQFVNPQFPLIAQNPNFYLHALNNPALNTAAKQIFPAQINAPFPRAASPSVLQPAVPQFKPMPDSRVGQFPPQTHLLPTYPQGFPHPQPLPEDFDPWPGMSPVPSNPNSGMPWQGQIPPPSDAKPELIPLPPLENTDSRSPPAQPHYHLHSHPFLPDSQVYLPQSHFHQQLPSSRHQFDIFPPPNTKG